MRNLILLITIFGIAAGGCSTYHSAAIRHGAAYSTSGTGENQLELPPLAVRASAVGYLNINHQPTLQVAVSIDQVGLFKDSARTARLSVHVQENGPANTSFTDTLRLLKKNVQPSYTYAARRPAGPGRYNIKVKVKDLASGAHTNYTTHAVVPDSAAPGMGAVRAAVKRDGGHWHPLAGYNVAGRNDSIRFTLHVNLAVNHAPITLRAYLLRFAADNTISRINYLASSPRYQSTSLVYKGIDYSDSTVIHSDLRIVSSTVQIRFPFKAPTSGNYRFEVKKIDAAGGAKGFTARDFAVRSLNFPLVRSPHERAAPLAGLMKPARYGKLISITNPDSLRAAVRRFWLACGGDSTKARREATLYYQRVEAANRLFTNYKEGWKTDPGTYYILYGPPQKIIPGGPPRVATSLRAHGPIQSWVYSGGEGFIFDGFIQVRSSAGFPAKHFMMPGSINLTILYQEKRYWHTQQQRWKSGKILDKTNP